MTEKEKVIGRRALLLARRIKRGEVTPPNVNELVGLLEALTDYPAKTNG